MGWLRSLALALGMGQQVAQARIPDAFWQALLKDYPFLAWRTPAEQARLRELCAQFLRHKEFHGAQGFAVRDPIALAVAAQACLPVLQLGLRAYRGFVGIVMHEGPVRAQREWVDEHGLVHQWEEELVGEAMGDGPVMLSWHEGAAPGSEGGGTAFNVVIHEFVHILDGLDGELDGVPPLPTGARADWQETLQAAFDRFDERRACGYDSVMDAYGAQDVAEFFAVSSEAFFTQAWAFRDEQPALYRLYAGYYRQDPAAWAHPHPPL
jgi:Mlc titration factor MtfA (ptsG expression regulator)